MADIYGVKFDKINDYFDLDDNAAWDILMANGDQFYAFWLEQDTNTGADSQYWFSNNSFNAGNSVQCFVSETADTFRFNPQNATQQATTPAKTFPTGRVFIVCQYNSSNDRLEISYCEEGGLNERTVATVNLADDISSANWNLGRRQDGNSGRYYEGKIFNLAKGDTYLSDAQVEALASDFLNYDPNDEFTPEIYFPMNEGTGANITDDILGLIGTGIGFPGDDSQWILEGSTGGSAELTGTAVPTQTEADIVTGGKTIILTLTGDTWVTAGATFDAQRQAIIDGLDSAQSELTGWNNEVRDNEVVTAVVRTSSTIVTVTLTASASYDITATETITATIPNAALTTGTSDIIATPAFTVTAVVSGVSIPVIMNSYRQRRA